MHKPWSRCLPRRPWRKTEADDASEPWGVVLRTTVEYYTGSSDKAPVDATPLRILYGGDALLSALAVSLWIRKTYHQSVPNWMLALDKARPILPSMRAHRPAQNRSQRDLSYQLPCEYSQL